MTGMRKKRSRLKQYQVPVLAGALLLIVVLCIRCGGTDAAERSWLDDIEEGERDLVHCERYRVRWSAAADTAAAREAAGPVRRAVAEHPRLLNQLASECYPDGEGDIPSLEFRYQTTGQNREDGLFVVKYFARIEHPHIVAGYSCIFVVDEKSKVQALYIEALPLE
ncbi:hypothetical protein AMJ39_04905 [candidate division TA06 bacterium DG_24]|uniref:Uncharacterized protein n=3 Tax=Bacteria division TA06 TaxID=1156500 RepID=A0A0S8JFL7_UNCT6|nr:MAG: hypothetical protein AMJ39_04905 [candidate division TA06 bacterium DG_24]KPK69709.1 MAG: hypothetical protein AMJ82_05090 [candidate division TA06 bacterium SM23_40]KPL08336.1 MAG: hypothetical protein AMJ71_08475 [candidate division TA06 bacterium SM1_40]